MANRPGTDPMTMDPVEPLVWNGALARALIEHSADVILVLTADHHCRFASPALLDVLGYAPEAVLGADVIPLHHPDDLPLAGAMLAAAAAHPGQPASAEIRLRHHDGSWRCMAVTATNRLHDPAVRGIVCNLHDITTLRDALHTLEETGRRLTRQNANKDTFVRVAAHEIRTPLTAITGFADLLALSPDDGEQTREAARIIQQEARRLARLVEDLLLLERMEANALPLRLERVDLVELIEATLDGLRGLAAPRKLVLELAEAVPLFRADPEQLARVIVNLVANAIKYSPEQSTVTIAAGISTGSVWLRVQDEGIGIAAEKLPVVFERFRRVDDDETVQGQPGTGLGLPIVREIVALHGGQVWAESTPNHGSTFVVTLPLVVWPTS